MHVSENQDKSVHHLAHLSFPSKLKTDKNGPFNMPTSQDIEYISCFP